MGKVKKNSDSIAHEVWLNKYCCQDEDKCEISIEDSWQRVAKFVASSEAQSLHWQDQFLQILKSYKFLPGGRILANAGISDAATSSTLMNCFVMDELNHELKHNHRVLMESAQTLSMGGGVGLDFSRVPPKAVGHFSAGAVQYMKLWNEMSFTQESKGGRRSAMMACLSCDHPDIEEFIVCKALPGVLTQFNISVLVSDEFIAAVRENRDWELKFKGQVYKKLKAKNLWKALVSQSEKFSEPGVLFIDRINAQNNMSASEKISATNPCGEVPLPAHGSCNLGSLNLAAFVRNPFSTAAFFDFQDFEHTISVAVRFLDNVLDLSKYPLERQKDYSQSTRRIGLGITGLGSGLAMMNLPYGSAGFVEVFEQIMRTLCYSAYSASSDLAKERRAFGAYRRESFLQAKFILALHENLRKKIAQQGLRNSHLISIAPAGSISLLAENISSGIEPIFKLSYSRKIRLASGKIQNQSIEDFAFALAKKMKVKPGQLKSLVPAEKVSLKDQMKVLTVAQKYVDQAISKTFLLSKTKTKSQKSSDVFMSAYDAGLKGCTVFSESSVRGHVMR